jgi:hypothetical protein
MLERPQMIRMGLMLIITTGWMQLLSVQYLRFNIGWVVVYTQVTADATGHLTYVYDGRSGDLTCQCARGVVPVDGSDEPLVCSMMGISYCDWTIIRQEWKWKWV